MHIYTFCGRPLWQWHKRGTAVQFAGPQLAPSKLHSCLQGCDWELTLKICKLKAIFECDIVCLVDLLSTYDNWLLMMNGALQLTCGWALSGAIRSTSVLKAARRMFIWMVRFCTVSISTLFCIITYNKHLYMSELRSFG